MKFNAQSQYNVIKTNLVKERLNKCYTYQKLWGWESGIRSRDVSGKITFRIYFENKFFSSFWLKMYIELVHLFHSFINTYKKIKWTYKDKEKEKSSDKKISEKIWDTEARWQTSKWLGRVQKCKIKVSDEGNTNGKHADTLCRTSSITKQWKQRNMENESCSGIPFLLLTGLNLSFRLNWIRHNL